MDWFFHVLTLDRRALSLEWILLITIALVAVIGSVQVIRSAIMNEFVNLAEAESGPNMQPDSEPKPDSWSYSFGGSDAPPP